MNSSKNDDKYTFFASKFINILLLHHPVRTSIGIAVGVVLELFSRLFSPALLSIKWINLDRLEVYHFICAGIVLVHIPNIRKYCRTSTLVSNESVDEALEMIDKAPLKDWEKRAEYRKLISKVIDNIAVDSREIDNEKDSAKKT